LEKRAEGKGRGLLKSLSWHFPSYYWGKLKKNAVFITSDRPRFEPGVPSIQSSFTLTPYCSVVLITAMWAYAWCFSSADKVPVWWSIAMLS
jgi:hypothetical protein